MRWVPMFTALHTAAAASPAMPTADLPVSFTATVEYDQQGIKDTGTIAWDSDARWAVITVDNAETATYLVQDADADTVYVYHVANTQPSQYCHCDVRYSSKVTDPWAIFMGGFQNSSGCDGGSFFTNPMIGIGGSNYKQLPSSICFSGTTPKFTEFGGKRTTYTAFTAGRPKMFNTSVLEEHLPACGAACNGQSNGNIASVFHPDLTPKTKERVPPSPQPLTASVGDWPPNTLPASFEAEITTSTNGGADGSKGYFSYDAVAHRSYHYDTSSGETTIVIQERDRNFVGELVTATYRVGEEHPTPSCSCHHKQYSEVSNFWYNFLGGTQNSSGSGCSGTLYTNNNVAQPSNGGVQHVHTDICISGDKPVYTQIGTRRVTYDKFTAGRPSSWNVSALVPRWPDCSAMCSGEYAKSAERAPGVAALLHSERTPSANGPFPMKQPEVRDPTQWPQQLPDNSFYADVTFYFGGLSHKGFIQYDAVAHRMTSYNVDTMETTVVLGAGLNDNGASQSSCYQYSIIPTTPTSRCVCRRVDSCEVADPWYIYAGCAANTTGCDGGSLFTNTMVGYNGHNVLPGQTSLCMKGTTPVYTIEGSLKTTFDTFKPGRPDSFNTSALEPHLPNCLADCTK